MSVALRLKLSVPASQEGISTAMHSAPYRLPTGGAIDRSAAIAFSFDGKSYLGHTGDTLASALLANGEHLIGRSFKYHRPRGIYGCGPEEPNGLVTVDRKGMSEPNTLATTLELFEGLVSRSQNRWPSLAFDLMGINQWLSPLLPSGFYYKTFMWPGSFWMFYERLIRRAAGMGEACRRGDSSRYETTHLFCDLLVVGAGPAGLAAALAAGRAGARVTVVESDPLLGGALWRDDEAIGEESADAWVGQVSAELTGMPNVRIMSRTTAFGYYDHNVIGAIERVTDHIASPAIWQARHRLHIIRAKRVVLATGAIERPLVFENNDRPGVMLAGAVRTYLKRFAVAPGKQVVVFTNNDDAYRTALRLHGANIAVNMIVDSRPTSDGALAREARRLGMECLTGCAVLRANGKSRVNGVEIVRIGASGEEITGKPLRIDCDLLAVSGGWSPTIHLHSQSGGKAVFDETASAFVPGRSKQAESSAGSSAGAMTLSACLNGGFAAGAAAATALGFDAAPVPYLSGSAAESVARTSFWVVAGAKRHAFVDIQTDVTTADVALAHREGYVSVEHLKRYTTLGMGTDQGKTSNVTGLALMAKLRGRSIDETGTTTFRPPYVPVAIGAFAGREMGAHYQPVRRTPMHDWHLECGAQMVETGLWMRPRCYPQAGETLRQACAREAAHVRQAVGLIDVSTLGKIDVQGPDALEFLERVYANNLRSLGVGRVRYGLLLREDGIVFDDGTCTHLSERHYLMTTTTANAAKVLAHLELLLQAVWPQLRVHVTSVTEQWATMALAGPRSRWVLSRVIEGGMAAAATDALPHLGVLGIKVAGVQCRVSRMSYSGELAYEIAAPADRALHVWRATLDAGRTDNIGTYGTEAANALRIEKGHVAGPELDGRTTADDLGLGGLMSTSKDFIGRRLSQRSGLHDPERPKFVGLMPLDSNGRLRAGAQIIETPRAAGITPMVGHVSSVAYSTVLGHDIALGFVRGGRDRIGQTVYAAFPLREEIAAVRIVDPVFCDKAGERFRG
jgi:heterotetrameric sarcosine oxidase alpha subunit